MRTPVFYQSKILALVLAFLVLGAFAVTMRGYSSTALAAEQTAVLKSGAYTDVVAADGTKVPGLSVALLPGKHTIQMKPSDNQTTSQYGPYYFYSWVTGSVEFTAEPGHTYVAYVKIAPTPATAQDSDVGYPATGSTDTGFTWVGYITDETTGKRLAKTDRLTLQAQWRGYPGGAPMRRR
jgi:hypothetical protein